MTQSLRGSTSGAGGAWAGVHGRLLHSSGAARDHASAGFYGALSVRRVGGPDGPNNEAVAASPRLGSGPHASLHQPQHLGALNRGRGK